MRNKGFTLVELMIVIAIIALLAAVALPKFASATEAAKVANVQGNLANLRTSLAVYYAKNKTYPTFSTSASAGIRTNGDLSEEFQNFYSNKQLPLVPSGDNVTVARRSVINGANGAPNTGVGGWKYDATKGDIRANLPSASGSPKTGGAYGENTIDWELE